jgi:hypothetical protein
MKDPNYLLKILLTPSMIVAGTMTLIMGLNAPAMAQTYGETGGEYQRNEQNGSDGTIEGLDPIQLIHNANLRRSRGAQEFSEDANNQLDEAAEDFRKLQLQRLQEMREAEQAGEVIPEN